MASGLLVLGMGACGGGLPDTEREFVSRSIARDPSGDLDAYVAQEKESDLVDLGRQVCIDKIDGKRWPIGGNPKSPEGKVLSDRAVEAIRSAAADTLCT